MATGDFDLYYSDNPWETMNKNQRSWIDPVLATQYRLRSTFAPTLTFVRDLKAQRATSLRMTQIMDPHPDTSPLAMRQIWMPASHVDSRERELTFSRYGGKVAYHKYDDLVTYWQLDNQAGLRRIMDRALGIHMMDTLDLLARNAYILGALQTGFNYYAGEATDFDDITPGRDMFDPKIGADIHLGMSYRKVPYALGLNGVRDSIVCFTSPGVVYDIQDDDKWIEAQRYGGNGAMLLNYEAGAYKNVRYVQDPRLTLWNAGTVIAQAPIKTAVNAGDGAPGAASKVDSVWTVGQSSAGIVNFLELDAFGTGAITDLAENDIVSVHLTRTAAYGVADGVNPLEGTLHNRRIVSIDAINGTITLDEPIMIDMKTDLGGGVYGYVTKGVNVHASIFVAARDGIAVGVGQSPMTHTPPPVDDFESVYRFSWDAYMGYQAWSPEVFEVVFSSGTVRHKGAKTL